MITQYEVYSFLAAGIPQLAEREYPSRPALQMFASVNYFTDYTRHMVEKQNFGQVKKCFKMAEDLYLDGDTTVRSLIENSFIHPVFSVISVNHPERSMVKFIIPETLLAVYIKQLRERK